MSKGEIDSLKKLIKNIKENYNEILHNQDEFEKRCYSTFTIEDDNDDIVSILGGHKEFIRNLINELYKIDF